MKKIDLVNELAARTGMTKADANRISSVVFEIMKEAFATDEGLKIPGFLSGKLVEKTAKVKRNPHTGGTVNVPAKKVPSIKFSRMYVKEATEVLE